MNRKSIIMLFVFAAILCSGCSRNNDFIGRTAEQNNRWLSLYSEKIDSDKGIKEYKEFEYTDVEKVIKDSVLGTEFEKYVVDDMFCIVDLGAYANSKIEALGYNTTSLSISESSGLPDISKTDDYEYVKIEDIVCMKDKSGYIVSNHEFFRVLLSEHKDVMAKLDKSGIGDFIRNTDNYLIDNMENIDIANYMAVLEGYGGCIWYSSEFSFLQDKVYKYVNCDTEYIIKEQADDAWSVISTVSNDVCDSVLYTINEALYDGSVKKDMNLYVYGRNGKVEEINYVSDTAEIPDYARDTVINYLVILGMDKDNAEFLVSNPPKDDGSMGNVKYFAGKKQSKYFMKVSR
ncbi:MAG: hypothetical protein K2I03_01555 [Lachnospiraceae bacterium]|nr:hypothetical protein [Lachnospiraceae bacterium]